MKEVYMRSNVLFFLLVFELLLFNLIFADKFATTEDGKKVILKDDGTWEYVKEESKSEDKYDFRSTNWGMSKTQVKATEKMKLIKEYEDLLSYNGSVGELNCNIIYIFVGNKLVRSKYFFINEHFIKNDYIYDYNILKDMLEKKYGKPIDESQIWKNNLYKDDKENWGLAISIGHLLYYTIWETPSTIITLALDGDNFEINLQIEYSSKKLKTLEEKQKGKKILENF